MNAPDLVLYHADCDDGIAAAWAIWKRCGYQHTEYRACQYGQKPPNVAGKDVLIVDFSFKAPVLQAMAADAYRIVVLDHHQSAAADLSGFLHIESDGGPVTAERCARVAGGVAVHFNMEKSGARLAWEYARGDAPMPELLEIVEDRDLWRFAHPLTRMVSAALRSYPRDIETFDERVNRFHELPEEGRHIQRYMNRVVENICKTAFVVDIGGERVPAVACSYDFVSEAAHALLKMNPAAPFAAAIVRSFDGVTYSLRSEDHRADVSEIARRYGGGGHRNAAGFRWPDQSAPLPPVHVL